MRDGSTDSEEVSLLIKCASASELMSLRRRVQTKLPGLIARAPYQNWSSDVMGNTYPLIPTPHSLPSRDVHVFSAGSPGSEWKMSPSPNRESISQALKELALTRVVINSSATMDHQRNDTP